MAGLRSPRTLQVARAPGGRSSDAGTVRGMSEVRVWVTPDEKAALSQARSDVGAFVAAVAEELARCTTRLRPAPSSPDARSEETWTAGGCRAGQLTRHDLPMRLSVTGCGRRQAVSQQVVPRYVGSAGHVVGRVGYYGFRAYQCCHEPV